MTGAPHPAGQVPLQGPVCERLIAVRLPLRLPHHVLRGPSWSASGMDARGQPSLPPPSSPDWSRGSRNPSCSGSGGRAGDGCPLSGTSRPEPQ